MEIIEKRIEERKRIIRKAQEYSLTFEFKTTVILIGSYARGDFNLWSDVDVMIIGDFNGSPLDRLKNIDFPLGYEIIPLTEEEFYKMKNRNNKLVKDALAEGVILRDDLHIFCRSLDSK